VFWENRTERDRAAIRAAAILIALAIAYAYVWLPVTRERDRLLVRLPELRAEARAMEIDMRELDSLKTVAQPAVALRTAIQKAAEASRLPAGAAEIVQQGPATARVAIASARAEQALTWVARLQSVPGVRLESMRLISLGDGDRVNVEAVLVTR
jgi:general secretion pathway protein M